MTSTINSAALAAVAAQTGPCLTVAVPDRHPGKPEGSQKTQLRGLIKLAKERAASDPKTSWSPEFEGPLAQFVESLPDNGGPGMVAYRTLDSFSSFPVAGDSAKAVLASHPWVMPLLVPAGVAQDLFVLGLNKKRLLLFEYVNGVCSSVPLPAGIPSSLEAASHPHHGTPGENRTPAGSNAGNMAGVRFGTAGGRESARDEMDHFCSLIDQGLHPLLKNRPLMLMGVKEEIAAFRRVSHYDALMHAEADGNIDTWTSAHVAELAGAAALTEYYRLGEQVRADFGEMRDRTRTAHGPQEVLKASLEGRVHKLCVRGGTEVLGPMEDTLNRAYLPTEDLVNAAVVETLRHGGEVYVLPAERLPVTESICAILRY